MTSPSFEKAVRTGEPGDGESSDAAPPSWSDQHLLYRGIKKARKERLCTAKDRISRMPPCTAGKRSSIYRGVTRHRWTGRYEAHLWDKSTWNESQNKKGKQVYLGAYDEEEAAARAYDLAALKYWGPGTLINFPVKDYSRDLEEMQNFSREDYLALLRRKSSGVSRGISKYRPLSSRWDSQFDQTQGIGEVNIGLYGEDMDTVRQYAVGLSSDRRIDLAKYIKWWSPNKSSQSDFRSKALDVSDLGKPDDVASEIKALEMLVHPTKPYEMPRLGVPPDRINHTRISAMGILMKSAAYTRLKDRISKAEEKDGNGEREKQNNVEEGGLLHMQSDACPLASLPSAPVLTQYNNMDPLTDPVFWSPLVPVLPPGSSCCNEVMKQE